MTNDERIWQINTRNAYLIPGCVVLPFIIRYSSLYVCRLWNNTEDDKTALADQFQFLPAGIEAKRVDIYIRATGNDRRVFEGCVHAPPLIGLCINF